MLFIPPITIDQTNLTSSIAIDDGPEYSAAATYGLEDVVIWTSGTGATFHAYESLQAANTGNSLEDPAYWLDRGAVNRLAMFDKKVGTVTSGATIDTTVHCETPASGLALFNLSATDVEVTVTRGGLTLYNETHSLRSSFGISDWYSWLTQVVEYKSDLVLTNLPPISGADVRVEITGGSTVECGVMVLGRVRSLGTGPFYGARGGITDYSRKTVDEFGTATLVERGYAKRHTYRTMVSKGAVDGVFDLLAQYRATPAVYIGHPDYAMTLIYGWARDWGIEITYPNGNLVALEIEGLI